MNLRILFKYCLPLLAVVILLLLAGCSDQSVQDVTAVGVIDISMEGRQMPSFNLPSPLSEDSFTSSDSLHGKVVLVSFFASWCRSCLKEIPLLKKLQNDFADKGFALIAIAVDQENIPGLKNLIQKQGVNYPVLLADEVVKKDFGGIAILPTMFLVDRDGKLYKRYSGHIERDSLVRDIKQLLQL